MAAHDTPVCLAHLLLPGEVFRLVGDEPGQPDDVLDAAAGSLDDGRDIAQRLLELADQAYLIETGSIAMSGPAAQIRGDDTIRNSYLGY